jgi:hypothetical protein
MLNVSANINLPFRFCPFSQPVLVFQVSGLKFPVSAFRLARRNGVKTDRAEALT